jgi:hypothetical protein
MPFSPVHCNFVLPACLQLTRYFLLQQPRFEIPPHKEGDTSATVIHAHPLTGGVNKYF